MGKALLIAYTTDSIANASRLNLFGYGADASSDAEMQVNCTEAATFSNLRARVIAGNSGTATFVFRVNGSSVTQTFQITGVAAGEDATNSDTLIAGDLFHIHYNDTGSNATPSYIAGNVSFSSGHGNFHGCLGSGAVYDVESATRFIPFFGDCRPDGENTEDNVEWKVRGYTSIEALQVNVEANARTNTSTFRNRINGGDGSLLAEFAGGATGRVTDTSPADSLSDGQTINASITLSTGLEDLTVNSVVATLKSSDSKSETFGGRAGGNTRTASATAHYFVIGGSYVSAEPTISEANARTKPGFAATVSNLRCYLSANTYTGDGTLKLYQNGSAVITTTLTASGGAGWYENTSDTITIDADDELSFEFDEGTSGSITIHSVGITFAPVAAGGATYVGWGLNSKGGWW